ncbi:MAG: hypothetical protein JWQ14_405 [Adhaeribacter sp.]|nr:hypothetical protein [Adhaeribacter sp.]
MKLRIQGNSLRMRVSEAEIMQFSQTGQVEEAIAFGPTEEQIFSYVLLNAPEYEELQVSFTPNKVTVHIPAKTATDWVSSDLNGIEGFINNGTQKGLKILIQKDLDCFHR